MTVVAFQHRGDYDVKGSLPSAGVALHLDPEAGDYWLDVSLDHCPEHLDRIIAALPALGYVMDESDTDDMNADGMLRIYLMEVEPNEHSNTERPVLRLA